MSPQMTDFESLAGATLETLMDAIDGAMGDVLDAELEQGILSLELDSGGQYILNKHAPSCQIWMSSPVSGATHFDYREGDGAWVSTRGGERLDEMLSAELEQVTGIRLTLA